MLAKRSMIKNQFIQLRSNFNTAMLCNDISKYQTSQTDP